MKNAIALKEGQSKGMLTAALMLMFAFTPEMVLAASIGIGGGTGGTEFQAFYNFIYAAATGYLGRSIAIVGGLIGLGIGAGTGKALPAVIGVFLAIFGVLGPTIVNALFTSATI
jgi:conjugal transfer pilus assembly protein TraA